jgi:hypothetical protein
LARSEGLAADQYAMNPEMSRFGMAGFYMNKLGAAIPCLAIAAAANCSQIQSGSSHRSDRLVKYNQLLRIEQLLGKNAVYAGLSALPKGW